MATSPRSTAAAILGSPVTLDVNRDFFDMREGAAYVSAFTSQPTSAVNRPNGTTMVFYLGRDRQLWLDRRAAGAAWARPVSAGVRAWSTPSVVWTGSVVAVFYKGAAGRLGVLSFLERTADWPGGASCG